VEDLQALVTRPRQEAESLAQALAARGVEALIEPMIEIHFHSPQNLELAGVQAILCTSANGVRALASATGERGVPVFAVGDATAACARVEGFTAVESAAGDAGDLARLAASRLRPEGGRLLHIAGDVVADNLTEALDKQQFTIERRALYEARPVTELSPKTLNALRGGDLRFALFFSPRTTAIFVRLANIAGVTKYCAAITALSISPAADAALASVAWLDRRSAERPNQPALLDMLDRVLSQRRQVWKEQGGA
jgi:uroporphyrinogen-III synthase